MRYFFILVLPFLPVLRAQVDPSLLNNVTQAFSQAQIVPNILPSFAPTDLVNITISATPSTDAVSVAPGSLLLENQTVTEPMFSLITDNITDIMGNETFVLALVDPDAPSPQGTGKAEFLHFMGGNFSLDLTSSNLVNQSAALLEWFPPSPPAGDPPHRYVLVVYQQPDNFSDVAATLVNASTPRSGFDLSSFTSATNLTGPIAGNYFLVGPDNSTSTTSSVTPSATLPPATATLEPTLTAPPSSSSLTSSVVVISTSTLSVAPATTSTSSAIGYPVPVIGSTTFAALVLARELFSFQPYF